MKKVFLISLGIVIVMLLSFYVSAGISCRSVNLSVQSCDKANPDPMLSELVVLNLTDRDNAHAALPNATLPSSFIHRINICCKGVSGLNTTSNPIAWLTDTYNAHASVNTSYASAVYLNSPVVNVSAKAVLAASITDNGTATCYKNGFQACVFTISDLDDAHAGDCQNYTQSALNSTGGRVYALCVNASCAEGQCSNGYRCSSGNWTIVNDANRNNIDDNCEPPAIESSCNQSFYDSCPIAPCRACVNGTVSDNLFSPLQNAKIEVAAFPNVSVFTNVKGIYFMALPQNNHTFVASKNPYTPGTKTIPIPEKQTTTVNFQLGYGPNDCISDCTRESSNGMCDRSCDGTNGCRFYDSQAADVCDGIRKDFRRSYPGNREIQCCEGSPYTAMLVKNATLINATVVARVTKTVWYEGKLVKMIVDVFG